MLRVRIAVAALILTMTLPALGQIKWYGPPASGAVVPGRILFYFRTNSSTQCRALEQGAFNDPSVIAAAGAFPCVQVDTETPAARDLVTKMQVSRVPLLVLSEDGRELRRLEQPSSREMILPFLLGTGAAAASTASPAGTGGAPNLSAAFARGAAPTPATAPAVTPAVTPSTPAPVPTAGGAAAASPGGSHPVAILSKSPEAWRELGDVVGISPQVMTSMGLKDGDFIELKTSFGKSVGAEVKTQDNMSPEAMSAKKSTRTSLGVDDGAVNITLLPLTWPTGDPKPGVVKFSVVSKPPKSFLKKGRAVGISLEKMRAINASPGQLAVVTGPNSKQVNVGIYLLDRGNDVIAMRSSLRTELGIGTETADISLEPRPGKISASEASSGSDSVDD